MRNESLAETFLDIFLGMVNRNNLTFWQIDRPVTQEAFHCLIVVLTSAENIGVFVRRARDDKLYK